MINCYIIDDEQHSVEIMEKYVNQTPFLKLAGSSTNALEALKYVSTNKIDLIFLDIHMPEISGIDLLKIMNDNVKVILTTAYSEYALEGFEHDVVDYLLKPVTYQRFLKASQKALNLFQSLFTQRMDVDSNKQTDQPYLFVKTEHKGKQIKINFEDIDYIEGIKNYVAFHCANDKVLALMNMKDLESTLPKSQFARVHNSYIISLNRIVSVEGNQLIIRKKNQVQQYIPIGITFKSAFFELIRLKK
ncbi:LytR/AlgR family response regulator transcription factor [Chitinophaga nivalis]|uniref:LytTR family DNA-binding domain-containing protein n=1 Tax=Chitinophaga nivalis TaxID=2991709 RepID=A0ABT3INN4_9BACT|nr:LytTR family DNA-binding domain-containing protein [Chitinophaga nivalis]MCW3464751.1 LytTR family DNA-binding domain-containing protein [Chitinophaga nivalis]MCW3485558.1 LytTR family DNA-binding domain-containing protein [Chitinophaga nivalis]